MQSKKDPKKLVLALAGGVGGAKLAHGLSLVKDPCDLVIVVNTGDDFTHFGFHISPDLDSVIYKFAGINDPIRGWGIENETWNFMDALSRIGGETWFNIGDRDLATHVERTQRLAEGQTLSEVTQELCRSYKISQKIVPMSDHRVGTIVDTEEGDFFFQDYFVKLSCKPVFTGVHFKGMEHAAPALGFTDSLSNPALAAVIICPSNPFISIEPILSLPCIKNTLEKLRVPVVAVSPIIGNKSIKGPAAKMLAEIGLPVSPLGIVKDQLEIRWSEPYWEEYGSGWTTLSRLELRSLKRTNPETSRISRIFQPIKHISIHDFVQEEKFNNEPFILNPSYGIHRLRIPRE